MKPKRISIDAASGIEPIKPPLTDLNIIVKRMATVIRAKRSEDICPLIIDLAKSAIIIAYPPMVTSAGI